MQNERLRSTAGTSHLAIDIETVSQGKRAKEFLDQCHKFKAPSNYKDEAKIKAYIDSEKEKESNRDALYWWRGRVLSVATIDIVTGKEKFYYDLDETVVLDNLKRDLNSGSMKLWSKSGKVFDYPFLVGRYLANKMSPPMCLRDSRVLMDVDEFFGRSSASNQRTKLDYYAWGTGQELKTMEGSGVAKLYNDILNARLKDDINAEEYAVTVLKEYNLHDCEIVAEMVNIYYGGELV